MVFGRPNKDGFSANDGASLPPADAPPPPLRPAASPNLSVSMLLTDALRSLQLGRNLVGVVLLLWIGRSGQHRQFMNCLAAILGDTWNGSMAPHAKVYSYRMIDSAASSTDPLMNTYLCKN